MDTFLVNYIIALGGLLEYFFCVLIFNYKVKKKSNFYLKLIVLTLGIIFSSFIISFIRLNLTGIFMQVIYSLILSIFAFFYIYLLYDINIFAKLLNYSAVTGIQMVTSKSISILINITGHNDLETIQIFPIDDFYINWTIYIILHFIFYIVLTIIFHHKDYDLALNRQTKKNIVILQLSTVITMNILFAVSRPFESESVSLAMISKLFALIISLIVIALSSGILHQSKKEQETYVLKELIKQENNKYESLRTNIDFMNQKVHDLRHQLSAFETKLTNEEITALKEAIKIYDSTIKTNYDVLDAILYEKQIICQKNNITLSIIADGNLVRFINPIHLYSVLNNALNNSIESCKKLTSNNEKIIDFSLREDKGFIIIEIDNYCNGNINFINGIPQSSKQDSHNHGYGYKSMKYIVNQYDGEITCELNNNIFKLIMYFPLNEKS